MGADLFIRVATVDEKHFRDNYSPASLLMHLGLSWHDHVRPMLGEEGRLSPMFTKSILASVKQKQVPDKTLLSQFVPNSEYSKTLELYKNEAKKLGEPFDEVKYINSYFQDFALLHDNLTKKKQELEEFLQYAVDHNENIVCWL